MAKMDIKKRFEDILGKRAAPFMSSVISLVSANKDLMACDPRTIMAAAAMAATLDLPVNKQMGFAWIIPYNGKAEFQIGYKGFIQLAIRTGQYKTMNTSEVYEDEIREWNPITGEIEFTKRDTWKMRDEGKTERIVGYVSFFKLLNGFTKYIYMTKTQMERHAARYSPGYHNPGSKWKKDFNDMAKKTVLKLNLSRYGVMSIEMQRAITADQSVVVEAWNKDGTPLVAYAQDAKIVLDENYKEVPLGLASAVQTAANVAGPAPAG